MNLYISTATHLSVDLGS